MIQPTKAYIGLGSNLGNRRHNIQSACDMLAQTDHIELARISDIIETPPLGSADQLNYLNAVAEVKTKLNAYDLFNKLEDIEKTLGRVHRAKWSPRSIDLDLLLFGQDIIDSPHLIIPHPQLHLRSFVLKGLCQLNPNLIHPCLGETVSELASRLAGCDFYIDSHQPQLISVAGIIGVGKTTLAKKLSIALSCDILLEPYDTNPFLPQVYAGKKELALDSQLYFLTARVGHLNRATLPQGQLVVTDYIFNKELIYARQLLSPRQLELYEKIYPTFAAQIVPPVLVIFLQDSAQSCLERIRSRNRPYEQRINLRFLEALSSDYKELFTYWKACPIIRLLVSKFDSTKEKDIEHLTDQIGSYVTCKVNERQQIG
jgi:deoxyguanosine kinase